MGAMPVLFWRFTIAAAVAWAFALGTGAGRRSLRSLGRRRAGTYVLLGTIYVGNGWAFVAALSLLPVSLVSMVVYIHPVFVAVLITLLGRGVGGRSAWIALAVTMAGIVLSVGGVPPGVTPDPVGLALAILCPAIYAVWIVLASLLNAGGGSGGRGEAAPSVDASVATALMMSATATAFAIILTLGGGSIAPAAVPPDAWWALIAFGACSGIAVQAFYAGVRLIGSSRASLISSVEQVYTIAVAVLLLGEPISLIQVAGCALVVGGVIVAETGAMRRAAAA
jgi:drug/metabolite transporter (DMT)-like permease